LKKAGWVLAALVLAAVGYAACLWLFPSDQTRIRRLLMRVQQTASFSPGQAQAARLAAVGNLVDRCTPDVEVRLEGSDFPDQSLTGRAEVREAALAARAGLESLQIQLRDPLMRIATDRLTATVQVIAFARTDRRESPMIQELRLTLVKVDRAWKIARVEPLRSLGM
jgi:hypothetical protein